MVGSKINYTFAVRVRPGRSKVFRDSGERSLNLHYIADAPPQKNCTSAFGKPQRPEPYKGTTSSSGFQGFGAPSLQMARSQDECHGEPSKQPRPGMESKNGPEMPFFSQKMEEEKSA